MALLLHHSVAGQETGTARLAGSGTLDPSPASTWEDSAFDEHSTVAFSVRSSETSTRSLESFQGPLATGLNVGLLRSQPGFFRRRFVAFQADAFQLRGGDLEAWSDDPLVEGSSRGTGAPALDDASSLAWGAGQRSNGMEGSAHVEDIEVRSRWEEGKVRDGSVRGSGALHLEVGRWMASLRSQDGTRHAFSSGWHQGAFRTWMATNDRFCSALLLRLDSSRSGSGVSGSARWISNGFRHDGLPAGWAGSAALDVDGRLAFERRGGTSLRIQIISDSSDHLRSRAISASHARILSAIEMGLTGTCTREPDRIWSSARWKIAWSGGALRPWMEHSWNDSASASRYTSAAGFAWGAQPRTLRGRLDWDWTTSSASALVSQELVGQFRRYQLGFRLEAGQNLVTRAVRGQGAFSCDW